MDKKYAVALRIVVVGKHAMYAFFDDFHFLLFDFPHLSSFNACEELDHLIILYPLSPALMSIGRDIVPPITMVAPPLTGIHVDGVGSNVRSPAGFGPRTSPVLTVHCRLAATYQVPPAVSTCVC